MRMLAFFTGMLLNLTAFGLLFFAWFLEPRNAALLFVGVILFPTSLFMLLLGYTSQGEAGGSEPKND
jgi:hypothetical protein